MHEIMVVLKQYVGLGPLRSRRQKQGLIVQEVHWGDARGGGGETGRMQR